MLIAWVCVVLAVLGLLVYLLATNAKAVELGRLMFFAGVLAFAIAAARLVVKIGPG